MKTREHTAEAFAIAGIALLCGSTGACENGDYSLLQYIFCCACGITLVLTGKELMKEV